MPYSIERAIAARMIGCQIMVLLSEPRQGQK